MLSNLKELDDKPNFKDSAFRYFAAIKARKCSDFLKIIMTNHSLNLRHL
jgi:hypothetical protein